MEKSNILKKILVERFNIFGKKNIQEQYKIIIQIQDKNVIYLDETQIIFLLTILAKSKNIKCALNIKLFILLYYGACKWKKWMDERCIVFKSITEDY